MFEAGVAMAQEAARARQCRSNEEMHQHIIQQYTYKFGINQKDATAIADFREDVIRACFYFADEKTVPLVLSHMDGTPTTFQEQFDLMIMAKLPAYRKNVCGVYLGPLNEPFFTAEPISTSIDNTKYVRAESLEEARRVLIEDPTCSRVDKDCAIRQIYDDFVNGFNNDPEVEATIADEIAESLWGLMVISRPSNQNVAAALVLVNHLTQTQ